MFFAAIFFGVLPAEKMQIIVTRRNETVIIDKPCFAFIILFSEPYIRIDKFHLGITDENGLFDARGQDLTLIVMIDRRVGLSLSRGERVWS